MRGVQHRVCLRLRARRPVRRALAASSVEHCLGVASPCRRERAQEFGASSGSGANAGSCPVGQRQVQFRGAPAERRRACQIPAFERREERRRLGAVDGRRHPRAGVRFEPLRAACRRPARSSAAARRS